MALIPSKARTGIAALTFAAAVVPFVLATPAKAIRIEFLDASETVKITEDGKLVRPAFRRGEFVFTREVAGCSGAEHLLVDRQRALEERPRARKVARVLQQESAA